jgi:exonuclease SbcD
VLAGHFSVQGAEMAGSERTSLIAHEPKFTAGDLSVPPIDYAALGHIHQYQNRAPEGAGGPPVIYPSSIERVSFKEWDERKGFVLVDIDAADAETSDEKTTQFAFVETPARPFVALRIDAREAEDPTEAILDEIEQQDVEDAIVRVRYHIEEAQIADVDARRLREALSEAHAVAALERDVDPAERERRTVVTRESTLEDALRQYVAQREELASIEDDLVDAALDLEGEHDADRRG